MTTTTKRAVADGPAVKAAVLFCDIAGSTALYRAVGDQKAEGLIQGAIGRLKDAATSNRGVIIKTIGDELMCRFPAAADAAAAAMAMQRLSQIPVAEDQSKLRVRIGFAYGDVVERDNDVFGDSVNVAARMCGMAKADQILTTEVTAAQFDQELRSQTRLFDKTPVKGIHQEISVVQVVWERRNQTVMASKAPSSTVLSGRLKLNCGDRQWELTPEKLPCSIGRAEECDLVIPTELASRKHAHLEYRRGKFMLVDESSNGTYLELDDGGKTRVIYLRNEAVALIGKGRFALGARPAADPNAISFAAV